MSKVKIIRISRGLNTLQIMSNQYVDSSINYSVGMNKGKINTVMKQKKKQRSQTIINAHEGIWGRGEVRE